MSRTMRDLMKSARTQSDFDTTEEPSDSRKVGRPKGKRSDPSYVQISALVPICLHQRIKLALLEKQMSEGKSNNLDVSSLIESLLEDWLSKQEK
jgi:hypothetical protein